MLLGRFVDPNENFGLFMFLEYGVTLLVLALIYFLVFRRYKRFLAERYGYGLTSGPTILGVLGPGAFVALGFFGVNDLTFIEIDHPLFQLTGSDAYYPAIFALATPGIILATLWCLFKTKNILIALIDVPILYVYCFFCAVCIIFYMVALLLGAIGVGMFAGMVRGPKATRWRQRIVNEESSSYYDENYDS